MRKPDHMGSTALLVIVVATALAFDFTNGFHDSANAVGTAVATGALRPRLAVLLSAVLNVVGAFLSIKVATTIAKGIIDSGQVTLTIISAALLGAIAWNLVTWLLGLPSSSTHALIGGLIGAMLVAVGSSAVHWRGVLGSVVIPALFAPVAAGIIAALATWIAYRALRGVPEETGRRSYRWGQLGSASLVSLAHGTNDAQKTMGVITLALVAHGSLPAKGFGVPWWVIIAAATAMGLGTYAGGWRIIRTLGHRITDITPPQGFSAETAGGTVILASSFFGYPLSTTHVVSGGVLGSGLGRRAAVRWGVAGQILIAWVLTLPAAAGCAAGAYALIDAFGTARTTGAIVATAAAAAVYVVLFLVSRRDPVNASNVNPERRARPAVEPARRAA
ncbi:MAG: inorganic phosphate transporter [Actinobacteria bacterium]|nr:inorganic phosphate transporter [Actinomycetota bacterium]MBV8479779.1 inorganic phosphate transporter [Actinomycetota bacterium]